MSTATQNLSYVLSLVDRASAPLMNFRRRLAAMPKETRDNLQQAGQSLKNIGATIAAGVAAISGASLVQRADMETALGELASLGIKDLDSIRKAAVDFSNQWSGVTAVDFVRSVYPIKSGINTLTDEATAKFTALAALTAKATKASTDVMTNVFAQSYGIFRKFYKSDVEFGEALSGGISKATEMYRVDGNVIAGALSRIGKTASALEVPMAEQLAVLGILRDTTGSGEEAASSAMAIWENLAAASKKTSRPFVDASGKAMNMAAIMDMVAGAIDKAKDKGQAWLLIEEAFGGKEAVRGIKLLIENRERLRKETEALGQAERQGSGVARTMAEAMNQGLGESGRLAWQALGNVAEVIGKALSPALKPLAKFLQGAAIGMQKLIEQHPTMTKYVLGGVAALGGLTFALGAAAVAVMGFNAAMALNPVAWIIAGIVVALGGLIAAGLAIYAYWDEIKAWFVGIWTQWGETIKTVVSAIGAGLVMLSGPIGALIGLGLLLVSNWEAVGQFFSDLLTGITDAFNSAVSWITDQIKSLVDILPEFVKKKLGLKVDVEPQLARPSAQAAPLSYASPSANSVAAGAAGAAARPAQAEVTVRMDFANLPKGAALTTLDQHGNADLNVLAGLNYAPGQ